MAVIDYRKIYLLHYEEFIIDDLKHCRIMKTTAQLVFSFNCIYQLAVGMVAILFPATLITFYGGPEFPDGYLSSTFRVLGACILFGSVISAYIAINPDKYPILLKLMAVFASLTLISWVAIFFNKELPVRAFAFDVLVQSAILILALVYHPKRALKFNSAHQNIASASY
jgi:hypothetical protein